MSHAGTPTVDVDQSYLGSVIPWISHTSYSTVDDDVDDNDGLHLLASAGTVYASSDACKFAAGESSTDPQKRKAIRALMISITLSATFMVIEFVGGWYAGSLAVMSDAAHLLSDVGTFCMSLLTITIAVRKSGHSHSFGYHRVEILGALSSVFTLWLVTGLIVNEAIGRIRQPEDVQGRTMFLIAVVGMVVNVALVFVLKDAGEHAHSHGGLSGGDHHGHSHGGGGGGAGDDHGHSHGPATTCGGGSGHGHWSGGGGGAWHGAGVGGGSGGGRDSHGYSHGPAATCGGGYGGRGGSGGESDSHGHSHGPAATRASGAGCSGGSGHGHSHEAGGDHAHSHAHSHCGPFSLAGAGAYLPAPTAGAGPASSERVGSHGCSGSSHSASDLHHDHGHSHSGAGTCSGGAAKAPANGSGNGSAVSPEAVSAPSLQGSFGSEQFFFTIGTAPRRSVETRNGDLSRAPSLTELAAAGAGASAASSISGRSAGRASSSNGGGGGGGGALPPLLPAGASKKGTASAVSSGADKRSSEGRHGGPANTGTRGSGASSDSAPDGGGGGGEARGEARGAPLAQRDVNMRGVYVHVLGDLLQSMGVALAGLIIWCRPQWRIVDPIVTFFFSALVIFSTTSVLRDIADIIMARGVPSSGCFFSRERTPRGVDSEALERDLLGLPGVASVHDLHVWSLMPGKPLLAVHVVREAGAEADDVLASVRSHCRQRLGIAHVTIQVEGVGAECSLRTSEAGGGCGSHL